MQGFLVVLYLREAADGFVEAVVGGVVVALAHFAHHHFSLARLAIEAVIEILFHADALPGMQDDLPARLHHVLYAVDAVMNWRVGKLLVLVRIIEFDYQVATSTIDDIFHFGPMEVHRSLLILLHNHNLLGIGFLIDTILAVADGEEEEADWKANKDKVGYITERMLGWDITDFGSGDFLKRGLFRSEERRVGKECL